MERRTGGGRWRRGSALTSLSRSLIQFGPSKCWEAASLGAVVFFDRYLWQQLQVPPSRMPLFLWQTGPLWSNEITSMLCNWSLITVLQCRVSCPVNELLFSTKQSLPQLLYSPWCQYCHYKRAVFLIEFMYIIGGHSTAAPPRREKWTQLYTKREAWPASIWMTNFMNSLFTTSEARA